MKEFILALAPGCIANNILAQAVEKKKTPTLWERLEVAESMSTAEQKDAPAQFQITLPKKDTASWLLNLGVSYLINLKSQTSISTIEAEYHRNTLTDEEQNNFQIGYGLTQKLETWLYLDADAKYVYDGVKIKNSLASNLLFSLYNDGGQNSLNLNVPNYYNEKKQTLCITQYFGAQIQSIFKAKNVANEGFILRPLFNIGVQYDFNKKKDSTEGKYTKPKPLVGLFTDYTGRVDAVNSTDTREHYTQLFKAGIEYFLAYQPLKVSIGGSFNYGSDPRAGLEKQQFWLISLNISKRTQ
ncbi:hypothetical protein ACLOAU_16345 [Niabella sp. CJ426]|uniref:hypothetical protein n=1 Tax=Niabella sp. CJ426 TaxID=3393740 RepID=UPI003D019F20